MSVLSSLARPRRTLSGAVAAVGVVLLFGGSLQVAAADTITASASWSVTTPDKTLSLPIGQTKTVALGYTATDGDSKNGCNLSGSSGTQLKLDVKQTPIAPTTGAIVELPATVTFTSCGATLNLNVKALQSGSTRVSFEYNSSTPAGNGASDYDLSGASFVVNVPVQDSTPPSVNYSLTPAANTAGWNNSNVTVHWTVADPESAVTSSTGCDDATVTADTLAAGASFTCSATSAGGTASKTATVKLDKTAPTVTPAVSGSTGQDGWYTGDVTIAWTISDGGNSTVASESTGCSGATLTADTTSQTYSCTVADVAGNSTTSSVTVKRDATKPVITKVVTGTVGDNGWYRGDVAVDWTVSDTTSGLSSQTDCNDASVTADQAEATYSCNALDNAGNANSDSVKVKRDATAPSITPHVTGTEGENGWYTSDVAISWTLDDNLSGIAAASATGCDNQAVTADTSEAGTTFSCSVKDNAGNEKSESVTIQRDATAPALSHTITGTEGDHGWYKSDAGLSWEWSDDLSGIGTTLTCDPVTQSTETGGTTYTCTVTDLAGNSASDAVVLKVDKSAPTLDAVVSGTLGDNDWYTSNTVGVTWDYADSVSGMGTDPVVAGCAPATVSEDTTGDDFACTVKDEAGNTASASTVVKKDSTAPTATSSFDGTSGDHGWYTTDGDLTWTLKDAISGVDASTAAGCAKTTIDHETSGEEHTCTVKDQAGNLGTGTTTIKLDKTGPAITPDVQGTVGDNGWYVGDVSVAWDVTDALSGMADGSTTGCGNASLATDTTHAEYTCAAKDAAGNPSSVTQSVKRDATKPVITKTVVGALLDEGWNTGDPSVDWTVTDPTSGLSDATDCNDATLTSDSPATTFSCHAVDNAGNKADDSVAFKRDATKPVITADVQGTKGAHGWYRSDVTVHWTVTDAGSGIATQDGCADQSVTADTTGVTFTCTAADVAGNHDAQSVTIKRDTTAPGATSNLSGTLGTNGWYTDDVAVSWTPNDDTSGVDNEATSCTDGHQTTDTTGTTFTCDVTDLAGNKGQGSVIVKRDATSPAINWTSGPADGATYDFGDSIPTAGCSASDATSGVTADGCTVTGGGTTTGTHTLTATALDKAGNRTVVSRTYSVAPWTIDGFYRPTDMTTGVVNTVKAGSTVPLKFNVLKGGSKMSSGIGATFTATKVNCDGSAITNATDEFATTGQTVLRWDSTAQQWIQNWATPSTGKGKCYRVDLATADGSGLFALYQLK